MKQITNTLLVNWSFCGRFRSASVLVSSQFDYYANYILYGCPPKQLVLCENSAHLLESLHSTPLVLLHWHLCPTELLKQLYQLPIECRIRFKFASLTFKTLHTAYTSYVAELLQYHKPTMSMRSSVSHLLSVPRHNFSFGSSAFRIPATKSGISKFTLKHSLPLDVT